MSNELPVDTQHKIRAVLDTSVLLSAGLTGLLGEHALHLIQKQTVIGYSSQPILEELDQKLAEKFFWNAADRSDFLSYLKTLFVLVQPIDVDAPTLRDPLDRHVLGTAVAAQAHLIVTSDQDLLVLKRFKGIGIIHPKTLRWTFPDTER